MFASQKTMRDLLLCSTAFYNASPLSLPTSKWDQQEEQRKQREGKSYRKMQQTFNRLRTKRKKK